MKYAILVIETGEYLYGLEGNPRYTLRSTEEFHGNNYHIMLFNSKDEALDKLLKGEKNNAWVRICNEQVSTIDNIELFEVVEMPND